MSSSAREVAAAAALSKNIGAPGTGKVAVVTGVNGGIGAAIATRLLDDGYVVYGTSRQAGASRPWPPGLILRPLDVRDDAAVAALIDEVIARSGRIDVLVNNAGAGLVGALEETSIAEAKELFEVNFFGALRTTNAVLPHMRAARNGRIVFISSVLGFLPAPFIGMYAASKHALEGYSETLDHEVRAFGVRSVLIEPSFTATQFAKNQHRVAGQLAAYTAIEERVMGKIASDVEHGLAPEQVAEVVLRALSSATPRPRYPAGKPARSLSRLRRLLPSRMLDKGLRRQFLLGA